MKNKTKHIIKKIEPGSIAEELELEPGDELLRVNGEEIEDVFDYHFQTNDSYLELTIRKKNGEEWDLEIEKEYDEEIGITFENEFMDQYRSCSNNCIFCFIDQMPPGMRPTLYFKDDDSRLSFLQGNYITLTNMSDHDIDRIIRYHLAPINISFQTTNPELRCKMLHNRFAGNIFPKVQRLYEAGIEMNGQIVLCKGYNDGAELERSISDLSKYLPHLKSVSVVPVGLSKYRDGLAPLEPFTREDAKEVLATIHKWQKKLYEQWGLHFIHAGDEWYLLAGREVPPAEFYDNYDQLEDGVGMWRMYHDSFWDELQFPRSNVEPRSIDVVTGTLAAPLIREMAEATHAKYPQISVTVHAIQNDYFGGTVSVAGLVTGTDIIKQCKGNLSSNILCVPEVMLRDEKDRFLDDLTAKQLGEALGCEIEVIPTDGAGGCKAYLGELKPKPKRKKLHFSFGGR